MDIKIKIKKIIKNVIDQFIILAIKIRQTKKNPIIDSNMSIDLKTVYEPPEYIMHLNDSDNFTDYNYLYDLSIIVPVYNAEKYLEECILSLTKQKTKYNYEIIFINDGSQDSSESILYKYKTNNISIYTQINSGISAARNKGIELAKGRYIGFIDNDDLISDDYVEKLLDRAYSSNADVVRCKPVIFYSNINEITKKYVPEFDVSIKGYMGLTILKFDGFVWGACYKRSFWGNIKFPNGYWYEDMITRFLIYRRCKSFESIGEELYYKREHSSNAAKIIWNSKNIKCLDQLFLFKKMLEINSYLNLPNDETLYRMAIAEMGYFLGIRTLGLDDKIRKKAFISGAKECIKLYSGYEIKDDFEKALLNKDYILWKMLIIHEKMHQ